MMKKQGISLFSQIKNDVLTKVDILLRGITILNAR